ncbi:MAG: hypothetical protein V4591_12195 [Bdellovibrionota bacterium]
MFVLVSQDELVNEAKIEMYLTYQKYTANMHLLIGGLVKVVSDEAMDNWLENEFDGLSVDWDVYNTFCNCVHKERRKN